MISHCGLFGHSTQPGVYDPQLWQNPSPVGFISSDRHGWESLICGRDGILPSLHPLLCHHRRTSVPGRQRDTPIGFSSTQPLYNTTSLETVGFPPNNPCCSSSRLPSPCKKKSYHLYTDENFRVATMALVQPVGPLNQGYDTFLSKQPDPTVCEWQSCLPALSVAAELLYRFSRSPCSSQSW